MKKKLIMGVLVLCSLILIVSSVFAIQTYNVKYSNVFLEDELYNQKIQNKKPGFICTESYSDIDYRNENNQEKSSDYIQNLILAPMVITKAICDNHEIISN